MKLKLLFAFLILTFSIKADSITNGLLFKVSHASWQKPNYIFGTIHLICKEEAKLPAPLLKIMDSVSTVFLEVNMSEPEEIMILQNAALLPKTKTITNYISKRRWKRTQKVFKDSLMLDIQSYSRLKPFFMQSMVISSFLNCELGSLDLEIMLKAFAKHIDLNGLEKAQDQVEIIDKISIKKQFKEIENLSKNIYKSRIELNQLLNAYNAKDLKALSNLIISSDATSQSQNIEFLDKRNLKWISKIASKENNESNLFAFGAGHLTGKNGILNLLLEKGFKVEVLY